MVVNELGSPVIKTEILFLGRGNVVADPSKIERNYTDKLNLMGLSVDTMAIAEIMYDSKKAVAVKTIKAFMDSQLDPYLTYHKEVKMLVVIDGPYFKKLTGTTKIDSSIGYALPLKMPNHPDVKVVYMPNYQALFYKPETIEIIEQSLHTIATIQKGTYVEPGTSVLHRSLYSTDPIKTKTILEKLLNYDVLTCDIETFSLKLNKAGLGTIAFGINKHEGCAFTIDFQMGTQLQNNVVRKMLKDFFINYKGKLIYHNAPFDIKILINELFLRDGFTQSQMDEVNPAKLLEGIKVMTRDIEDTRLITYLATNSTSGNTLGLKQNVQEFLGNYAEEEINDIRKIPQDKLLEYNLKDCVATYYLYEKMWQKMVDDDQLDVYREIFLPSIRVLLYMEITGAPVDMQRVHEVDSYLHTLIKSLESKCRLHPAVALTLDNMKARQVITDNIKLVKKVRTMSDFDNWEFNFNSPKQKAELLYGTLNLPIISKTANNEPETGNKVVEKLINHAKDDSVKALLEDIMALMDAQKISSTFLPAIIKNSWVKLIDGNEYHFLHGNFNLGGTVSGRMSSKEPNLQNLPSGSTYGKLIKSCFVAPPGWLMGGADFASLEDRISALTTKDPNKLKVYTGLEIYEVMVDGTCHHIREDDTVVYDGKTLTGKEFYEAYRTL